LRLLSRVCQLLAAGLPRAELAKRLGVTDNTAITHCRNLFQKLGVHRRAELVEKLDGGSRTTVI